MTTLDQFRTFCRNSLAVNDVDPGVKWLRYMVRRMEMNREQVLWLCFLYGITYHLPSAYLIWSEFPDLEILDPARLRDFWAEEQRKIPFQNDKMKQRRSLPDTVESYRALVGTSQVDYFDGLLSSDDPFLNFNTLWSPSQKVAYFGRFSVWNWAQMLHEVAGLPILPPTLMLGEPESRSFTDGLAHAYGVPERVGRRWSEREKEEMEGACALLRVELGIDNYQLETLACAFKKVWRERDSRYVGYYTDRLTEDLTKLEANPRWSGVDWSLMWDARDACTPAEYRNPGVDKSLFAAPVATKIGEGHMTKRERRSIYLVGAPGTGKSTLMLALFDVLGLKPGPEIHLCKETFCASLVRPGEEYTLTSEDTRLPYPAWMWGRLRKKFSGTDALGGAASRWAREWLYANPDALPDLTLGEGVRLANTNFLLSLDHFSPVTIVWLQADDEVLDARAAEKERAEGFFDAHHKFGKPKEAGRVGGHAPNFRKGATTRATNLAQNMDALGIPVLEFNTGTMSPNDIAYDIVSRR